MKGLCAPFVLLLAVLGFLERGGGLVVGYGLARRGVDIPGPDNFIRHRYPSVVAFGDYLYMDGGVLSQRINGTDSNSTQSGQTHPFYAVNSTLSLRLDESWTNDTAGMALGSDLPPTNEQWLFNADGTGGGTWSQVPQGDFRDFSQLRRPVGAAFTQSAHVGFALGGQATSMTDSSIQKDYPGYALTDLVSYNFETGQWTNTSTVEQYGGYGTSLNARAEYIPFGPNGLLLFLGGAETPVDATNNSIVEPTWNIVYLHDPVTGKWYRQPTSGERPPVVERACSVGVQGPNNTYEIFIYGGNSDQIDGTSSDVHVLSLPGFVFFDAQSPGTPRADHGCSVVGKGKRQMLSYGGVDGGPLLRNPTTTPDPWKQGLGVYDMTEMKWVDSYDPNATNYESPAVVSDWYANGGMDTVACSSSTYGTPGNSSSTDSSANGSQLRRTGIIVGSTVGAVVLLTITGVLVFLVVRWRRRRRESTVVAETLEEYRPEPWPKDSPRMRSTTPGTLISSPTPVEPIEIHGTAREELPAEDVDWTYELPVPTPRLRPELPDRKYSY
ncbi:hypothetical protein F5Y06DRAFT_303523 [Hypoxylon sp. FL0890]|nr:hypothetical protein F5Y06DRAFT_303523 [Hypoxylon sp. FL0890]